MKALNKPSPNRYNWALIQEPAMDMPKPKQKDPSTRTKLTGAICALGGRLGDTGSIKNAPKIKWYPIVPMVRATTIPSNPLESLSQ